MSTDNVRIKVRNRMVEVKWVAQYCDHYMGNFIHERSIHDLSFQEISDMLRTAVFSHHRGNIYYGNQFRSDAELREATWLISEGDFTDLDDFGASMQRMRKSLQKKTAASIAPKKKAA